MCRSETISFEIWMAAIGKTALQAQTGSFWSRPNLDSQYQVLENC